MTLNEFGIESNDPVHDALDNLLADVNDVDETFASKIGPGISRDLAKAKQNLHSAKEKRVTSLEEGEVGQ